MIRGIIIFILFGIIDLKGQGLFQNVFDANKAQEINEDLIRTDELTFQSIHEEEVLGDTVIIVNADSIKFNLIGNRVIEFNKKIELEKR